MSSDLQSIVRYFGLPNFGDPKLMPRVAAPAGVCCCWCGEAILATDSGAIVPRRVDGRPELVQLPYHEACYVRYRLGSVGHMRRQCPCFGGQTEDPPGVSLRVAAEAALEETHRQEAHRHGACLGCSHERMRHVPGGKCMVLTAQGDCPCATFEENLS